jgi:hypothetical protein
MKNLFKVLPFFLFVVLFSTLFQIGSVSAEYEYYTVSHVNDQTKLKIFHSSLESESWEYDSICLLDSNGYETGYCIYDFELGSIKLNGESTYNKYIELTMPYLESGFGEVNGYIYLETKDEDIFVAYDIPNYLYYDNERFILIPGSPTTIYGYDLDSGSDLYFDGDKIDSIITGSSLTFTVPYDSNGGDSELFLNHEKSNTLLLYSSPIIYNDPDQIAQWYFYYSNILKAHDSYYSPEKEVVVAIIDSGIDLNHNDLKDSIWINEHEIVGNGIDDDDNGYIDDIYGWTYRFEDQGHIITPSTYHGTAVSGIIAATTNNGEGIVGIAKDTKLMSLDIVNSNGDVDENYVVEAIYYAADNGADIINLSLGGAAYNTFSELYDEAIEYAYKKDVLIVASAGNGNSNEIGGIGIDLDYLPSSPICNDGDGDFVLGVAALGEDPFLSTFSNYGSDCIDLSVQGEWVYTTTWDSLGSYGYLDGTSFSAPIVSGVAAMIIGQYPDLENWQVQYLLEETGIDLDEYNPNYAGAIGVLVDAYEALKMAEEMNYPDRPDILETVDEDSTTESDGGSMENDLEIPFNDVVSSHDNADAIVYLYEQGVISGYDDGSFQPDKTVNRAELLKILVEGQGVTPDADTYKDCFPDVAADWYAKYVCYAYEEGWVSGYPDGTFLPAQTVNKVEALKMLVNSQELEVSSGTENPFDDVTVEDWFEPYVTKAKELGILEETGSTFSPSGEMARAGISENLYRLLTY